MAKADSPTKTCGEAGCARPLRARGLCSTHYNQTRYTAEQRHAKTTVPCDWCGKPCDKEQGRGKRYAHLFCTLDCRDAWRSMLDGTNVCHLTKWHRAHPDYRPPLPVLWVRPEVRQLPPSQPRLFVAGNCRHCGRPFVDRQPGARSCSARCTRKYWAKLYKDDVPEKVRAYVYERDRWRCQICRRRIPVGLAVPHPKAATVDHIVTRSEGGGHEPANLRAAHFICNTRRNNRGGNEQLALIG